jgi:hypothetical protein
MRLYTIYCNLDNAAYLEFAVPSHGMQALQVQFLSGSWLPVIHFEGPANHNPCDCSGPTLDIGKGKTTTPVQPDNANEMGLEPILSSVQVRHYNCK